MNSLNHIEELLDNELDRLISRGIITRIDQKIFDEKIEKHAIWREGYKKLCAEKGHPYGRGCWEIDDSQVAGERLSLAFCLFEDVKIENVDLSLAWFNWCYFLGGRSYRNNISDTTFLNCCFEGRFSEENKGGELSETNYVSPIMFLERALEIEKEKLEVENESS